MSENIKLDKFEIAILREMFARARIESNKCGGFELKNLRSISYREKQVLEKMLATGNAPWKKWED